MAKKSKKKKTPSQKKRELTAISKVCFGGEFVSVISPFVTIGIVKYEDYFVEYNGTKMSIACVLAAFLMGFATWLVSKRKLENSFVTLLLGWMAVAGIFFLIGEIINDIAWIMLFGGIGIAGALGLDVASKKADEKAKKIKDAMDEAIKENVKEEYKQELKDKEESKQKKVRF